jgi:hypothetical protein
MCGTMGGLRELIEQSDIIIVHTTINSLYLIKIDYGDKPIIWNIHDWVPECKQFLDRVAAVIMPSKGYANKFLDGFNKPWAVIYPKVPKQFWTHNLSNKRIDYTCLVSLIDHDIVYRDYSEVRDMLDGCLHVYSAKAPSGYSNDYDIFEMKEHDQLFNSLRRYQYGWAGAANSRHDIDICVPQKYFLYLSAGVIPITWRSDELTRFGNKYQVSFEWGNLSNLKSYSDLKMNISSYQDELTMESEMSKLVKLFSVVLEKELNIK